MRNPKPQTQQKDAMLKTTKRTTALLTAAMSLGIAAPAGAMPFNTDAHGSLVPVEITPPAVQGVAPSGRGWDLRPRLRLDRHRRRGHRPDRRSQWA